MQQKIKILAGTLALIGVSACSTAVNITSSPSGAKVYVNEKYLGDTPLTVEKSNLVFNNYNIRLTKDGYRTINSSLEKEAKVGPIIGGILVFIPFFWCYGPQDQQSYTLEQGKAMLLVPDNIQVTVDSERTPLHVGYNAIATGKHTITIRPPDAKAKTLHLNFQEKQIFEVSPEILLEKQS